MADFTLWTSDLSPYSYKIKASLGYLGHTYQSLPRRERKWESLAAAAKIEWGKRRRKVTKYPKMTPLDEYPGVPFVIEPGGAIQYDSTGFSRWLDTQPNLRNLKLWPQDQPLRFIAELIDETFDELGLYIAHHLRWFHSRTTTTAGTRLYDEFGWMLFHVGKKRFPALFETRQVSRLPYLFSVPPGDLAQTVAPHLRAPRPAGYPPTHALLDELWVRYLSALESIFEVQPYLLGDVFTAADASVYGMFGILLDDPDAQKDMQERAPVTHRWLMNIREGGHLKPLGAETLRVSPVLNSLLELILETFIPLLKQNETAYISQCAGGEILFNEAAWRQERALYNGVLLGHPYRTVVKTFQVQVWRDLREQWRQLPQEIRQALGRTVPGFERFPLLCSDGSSSCYQEEPAVAC